MTMPPVAPEVRGVRVAGEVLVVPPFECAWLTSPSGQRVAQAGGGEVSFEAAAQSDITCILEEEHVGPARLRPTRRLDHWSGLAADDDRRASQQPQSQTYVIIIGSHRNSRLCIERNGRVAHVARGEFIKPGAATAFARYWISWTDDGLISVGIGGAGARPRLVHRWRDPEPLRRVRCVGLSTWDDWTSFRNIEIASPPGVLVDADVDAAEDGAECGSSHSHARAFRRVAPAAAVATANAARDDERRTNLADFADVAVVRRRGASGDVPGAARILRVRATFDRDEAISARYAADGTCVVSRAHAAVLAAASPALRVRFEEAARRIGNPRRRSAKTAEAADIAAALGGDDGSVPLSDRRSEFDPRSSLTSSSLTFIVEVVETPTHDSNTRFVDSEHHEMTRVLARFAGTDASANERALRRLFENPGPGGVASRVAHEFSDVVVAVRAGSVAEADEAVRAAGVPATVILEPRRFERRERRHSATSGTETRVAFAEFHAHRVVLACFAPFFRDVFASGMREASEHVVRFGGAPRGARSSEVGDDDVDDDVDATAVAAFLRFAYFGSFPDSAPAAETLALCLRFRAAAATNAVARALAEAAARDAGDAARLLALAPAFGVAAFDEGKKLADEKLADEELEGDEGDEDVARGGVELCVLPQTLHDTLTRLFSRCARSLARKVADADPEALAALPADAFAATIGRDDLGVADEDRALALAEAWVAAKPRSRAEAETVAARVRWPQTSAAAARDARAAFLAAGGGGAARGSEALEALFAEAPALASGEDGEKATPGNRAPSVAADARGGVASPGTSSPGTFSKRAPSQNMAVAADGASVSLSASARVASAFRDAARRRKPREKFGTTLTFLRAGDLNGVFRHVGTKAGRSHFRNPGFAGSGFGAGREGRKEGDESSRVAVAASSPSCAHTNPALVTSGAFARVNFAGPPRRSETFSGDSGDSGDARGSSSEDAFNGGWWRFDLGEARTLRCAHYSMRQDGTAHFPRHWELQGRRTDPDADEEGVGWTTLSRHVDDASIAAPGAWASWAIDAPACSTPVRFLRLVLTGREERAPEDEHAGRFHLCSAEFYGLLASGRGAAGAPP